MTEENRSQQVSLGCGSLILIALIVLIFSGNRNDELSREIHTLKAEISELRKSIDSQTSEIRHIQKLVEVQPAR